MTTKIKAGASNGPITANEARQLLIQEQQERVDACRADIEAVLQKYRCRLDVSMIITAQGNLPQLQIVAESQ